MTLIPRRVLQGPAQPMDQAVLTLVVSWTIHHLGLVILQYSFTYIIIDVSLHNCYLMARSWALFFPLDFSVKFTIVDVLTFWLCEKLPAAGDLNLYPECNDLI